MKINKLFATVLQIMNDVSTPPNKTSYYWKDSFSLISWIILQTLFVVRCFSLLQWIKYFVRKKKKKDEESKRPNVPSIVVELYYLILSIGFICIVWCKNYISSDWFIDGNVVIKLVAIYFFVDSVIWVLYYFFFRRFFEEKYAIMHTLEYIVTFPLVVILQACCLNIYTGDSVVAIAKMLINPDGGTPIIILSISVIYTAVILGLVISNLPIENVKEKGDYRCHLLILGYGEVIKGKLLNAVVAKAKKEKEYKNVVIYDYEFIETDASKKIVTPTNLDLYKYEIKPDNDYEMELFHKRILASNILWIATPPIAHLQYVEKYYNKLKMVVVEKPITIFSNELDLFRIIYSKSNNIFCLSYYYLEKALPLTYLYRPLHFYEKYLDIRNDNQRNDIKLCFHQLGLLKSVNIYIKEGADNRDWTFDERKGGQLFETFIHLLVLFRLVLGESVPHNSLLWEDNHQYSDRITYISATGIIKGINVSLEIHKELLDSQLGRGCKLIYQNGEIDMNFEDITLTMTHKQLGEQRINLNSDFQRTKYSVQLDMVNCCLSNHVIPSTVDGSDIQMECLQWLMDEKKGYLGTNSTGNTINK